jgi:hypothetical protein
VRFSALFMLFAGAALPKGGDDSPPLPPANVVLRVDAPDLAGPWKMVVTNRSDVPVRFAADGRLLSLEIAPEDVDPEPTTKKKKRAPKAITCKLPPELRPAGVVDDRAVILAPGARYEEVFSPALYCFSEAAAKVMVPGAHVTAKLGFPAPANKTRKNAMPRAPLVVEPAVKDPTVSGIKELATEPFALPAAAPISASSAPKTPEPSDPNGPKIELIAPPRVDTPNERTVTMTFAVKNVGGRAAPLHIRRDNLMFDVDGPDGSAHCGQPWSNRGVPKEFFSSLGVGASRTLDVWVGEMCPDVVFDRPGLYRIRASLSFPAASEAARLNAWTQTVTVKEPILVRVREGRLPFYTSPPQVFGAPR